MMIFSNFSTMPVPAGLFTLLLLLLAISLDGSISGQHSWPTAGEYLPRALSKFWRMDARHRAKFGREIAEFVGQRGGAGDGEGSNPDPGSNLRALNRPVPSAYRRVCNAFHSSSGPNQSKTRQNVEEAIDALMASLQENKLFKKAARLYRKSRSVSSSASDESGTTKSFDDHFRSLWFSPSDNPAFPSLMCRFSAESGNWLSFFLDQPSLEVKRIRFDEQNRDALVDFARKNGPAGHHLQQRHFLLGDSMEFELSAITLCSLLGRQKNCSFSLGDGKGQIELIVVDNDTESNEPVSGDDSGETRLSALYFELQSDNNSSSSSSSSSSRSSSFRLRDEFPSSSSSSSSVQFFRDDERRSGSSADSHSFRHHHHRHHHSGSGSSSSGSRRRWETVAPPSRGNQSSGAPLGRSKSMPSLRAPQNIQQLVDKLWEQDRDRVDEEVVRVDWQQHMPSRTVVDVSPRPLISVSDESFLQQPIYAALVDIYTEQLFHPPVCQGEPPMNAQRRAKFDRLWQLVTGSDVFRTVYEYLDNLGKTGHDFDSFARELFDRWFGAYTRCKSCNEEGVCRRTHSGPLGSSGWEHVFSGEWVGTSETVDGHHNWVRFYLQQKAGDIEYHGYYVKARQGDFIGTIQYKWKQYLKRIGGFLIRTSPAFDFALFTACALSESGNQGCKFDLLGTPMFVTSFLEGCTIDGQFKRNFCISTTFPGIRPSRGHH